MQKQRIKIKMFGTLELEYNGKTICESDSRSPKLWLLLTYIICSRYRTISQKELLEELWGIDADETNVLKTTLHRLRRMLSEQFDQEFAQSFIVCRNKQYSVGDEYEFLCDFEEFEEGIKQAKTLNDEKERLTLYQQMFELYSGDFLAEFSEESWVTPLFAYYRSRFLELVQNILIICEKQKYYKEAIDILGRAGEVMKYEESVYVPLIRILIRMENYADAIQVYERLNDMLKVTYGVKPSKEARNLYYEAQQAMNTKRLSIEELPAVLMEQESDRGALYCEFDLFKMVYQAYVRGIERSDKNICLVLLDITDLQDKMLSKRSLATCTLNLKGLLCNNLRSEDIVSMCTPSQFVLLLQNVEEETALIAIERIKTIFYKQYPHTPAKLTCRVNNLK